MVVEISKQIQQSENRFVYRAMSAQSSHGLHFDFASLTGFLVFIKFAKGMQHSVNYIVITHRSH